MILGIEFEMELPESEKINTTGRKVYIVVCFPKSLVSRNKARF